MVFTQTLVYLVGGGSVINWAYSVSVKMIKEYTFYNIIHKILIPICNSQDFSKKYQTKLQFRTISEKYLLDLPVRTMDIALGQNFHQRLSSRTIDHTYWSHFLVKTIGHNFWSQL